MWRLFKSQWQRYTLISVGLLGVGFLLLYRLGSLTGGLSNREVTQQLFSSSWHNLAHNPLNAPLTVVQWLLLTLFSHHGQTLARLPSVLFGILTLIAFAYVLRRWYGLRTAIFGTVLFGLSSWFLHISRLGTTDILYLWAIPTLLAVHLAWQRYIAKPWASFLAIVALAALLYIPGLVWLIFISLLLHPRQFAATWQHLKYWWARVGLVVLFILLVAPLSWAFLRTPTLFQSWLGLPHTFEQPIDTVKRLADSVSFFVFRGPKLPELWLDRLPLLDIFSIVMVLLGSIFYGRHILLPRTRLLVSLFVLGAVFFALHGPVTFSLLVPIIYFVIAAGVGYLLHEWLRVFPRNPLARSVGFGLLGVVIILSCTYNVRAYFVAWPHSPTTSITFHNRR